MLKYYYFGEQNIFGKVTVVFNTITKQLGFSFQNPKDKFSKEIGKELALENLNNQNPEIAKEIYETLTMMEYGGVKNFTGKQIMDVLFNLMSEPSFLPGRIDANLFLELLQYEYTIRYLNYEHILSSYACGLFTNKMCKKFKI